MKTIEVSDEAYELYQRLEGGQDLDRNQLALLLFVILGSAASPTLKANLEDLLRSIFTLPKFDDWRDAVADMLAPIRQRPGVMGGAPCIGDSRIPVWALVSLKKQAMNDGDLLRAYPSLQASDLEAAWGYYTVHSDEINGQIKAQNEEDELG